MADTTLPKIAIFGASGNFGQAITKALLAAGFSVTAFTRVDSKSTIPDGVKVIRTDFVLEELIDGLKGCDVVVNVLGPGGIGHAVTLVDAAETAGVKRFIINDFGWGPDFRSYPEFEGIQGMRVAGWERAKEAAAGNEDFIWTGISCGNPIDWALRKFPMMGFDIENFEAVIYDEGKEDFTGTTLEGIGQAVVGVLEHPGETRDRHVKVRSIRTNQMALLEGFESAMGRKWDVRRESSKGLRESGERKCREGEGGWILELVVAQMFEVGAGRCVLVGEREGSDCEVLGVREEGVGEVVGKVLGVV